MTGADALTTPRGPRTSLMWALVVALAIGGCSSDTPDAVPESGVARDGTVALTDRLQETVDEFLASHTVPGASVAVIQDGELIQVSSGLADVDAQVPVHSTTEFRIA